MTSSPHAPAPTAAADEPGADEPIALVAGHGDFADGLVSAVAQITGRGGLLRALSNRGLGAADLEAALRTLVGALPVRVIFTDLPAGSCTMAARRLLRDRPDLVLVAGANLPAVIDFVLHGDVADPDAAPRAVERGRASLQVMRPPPPPKPAGPEPAPAEAPAPAATEGPDAR